jgi:hypothetical protein
MPRNQETNITRVRGMKLVFHLNLGNLGKFKFS